MSYSKTEILESMLKQATIEWAAKWDKIGIGEYENGVLYAAAKFIVNYRNRKEKENEKF
jgi:hypothetical protein